MIRHRVRWTAPAIRDLVGIRAWIAMSDPTTAQRVAVTIKEAVDKLETMPNRGRPGRVAGTRELILGGWPWMAIYEVTEGQVVVLRVLHGAAAR
ncbi:MAG: type II toxin-antitoxin system RelE/ParE family toxin [Rhodospirillales bacterium]|nr:type II toxin-antitoxin system RelE/ParE family toxin [Rhodospirillales bacterium]